MATLRQAMGDVQDGNRYIVNVPGRGYRFVAEVSHRTIASRTSPPGVAAISFHNLPTPLTRMIGREEIVAAIATQISHRRLAIQD